MKSILALSMLFLAQAFAKLGLGPCPAPTFLTFNDYQNLYTWNAEYKHKVIYGDKGMEDLLGFARIFVRNLPTFKWSDLFP